jgi:hypothetical protein
MRGAERLHALPRFHLDVNQGQQLREARLGRRCLGADAQAGHQIEMPFLALRRGQEHFLVKPGEVAEVEALRPGGEEAAEELLEEFLQQDLQPLVVFRRPGSRHDL